MTEPTLADTGPTPWHERAAQLLLFGAVAYNLPLALINAHAFAVSRNTLIAVEALLIGASLLLVALRWRPDMTRWAFMIVTFTLVSLLLSLFRQSFDPKTLRDMLMFATFIMLGMTVRRRAARELFVVLQIVTVTLMLIEVMVPDAYGNFVHAADYFVNTRGFATEQFYGSELFGANRADERYLLPQTGWIRASSIFLEPLSLGNYASFAMLAIVLFWRDWRWPMRLGMLVIWALVLIGGDGRFALTSSLIIVVVAPLFRRLPAIVALLYLPASIVAVRIASTALEWNPLEDNFPGRLARGMKGLFKLDNAQLAGFGIPTQALADSGMAYLVMGQSIAGVVLFQLFLYFHPRLRAPDALLMLHGCAMLFTLSILVSISMLSIKTAALLWFYVGMTLAARPQEAASKKPAGIAAGGLIAA